MNATMSQVVPVIRSRHRSSCRGSRWVSVADTGGDRDGGCQQDQRIGQVSTAKPNCCRRILVEVEEQQQGDEYPLDDQQHLLFDPVDADLPGTVRAYQGVDDEPESTSPGKTANDWMPPAKVKAGFREVEDRGSEDAEQADRQQHRGGRELGDDPGITHGLLRVEQHGAYAARALELLLATQAAIAAWLPPAALPVVSRPRQTAGLAEAGTRADRPG